MDYQLLFEKTREASRKMNGLAPEKINLVLEELAKELVKQSDYLLKENEKDLVRMPASNPWYDRLKLTEERICQMSNGIKSVAALTSPLGRTIMSKALENDLHISKLTVPIGVIGIIYEARPNVTCDAFVLCLKSGNAVVLKGGSDADYSNRAIIEIIKKVLERHGVDSDVVLLLPPERKYTEALLEAVGWVDLVIPRGSQQLINFVRQHAKVPVIETGAGIVHTYLDDTADVKMGTDIICNAKTRRVSVCNALDCLIIHEKRLDILAQLLGPLAVRRVEIYADERSYEALLLNYPGDLLNKAGEDHFGTEFLSLKMSIKTVTGMQEALFHINKYGSKHSEAIISADQANIDLFLQSVDAAAVYANASTAFTDGAEFGLGAEIGISTQKIHARGPMALEALTSYKWIIRGNGQVRET
ncbi:MAG: glutamate-5-semialdehyde dehydrogenase [Chitinophagaceae bacterium]